MSNWDSERPFRVAVVGSPGIGKTSLVKRRVEGEDATLVSRYVRTSGESTFQTTWLDSFAAFATPPPPTCTLQIVDGVATSDDSLGSFEGFIVAFSVVNSSSFEQVPEFVNVIAEAKGCDPLEVPFVLAACQVDLEDERTVGSEEFGSLSVRYEKPVFETSAKTGRGVNDCFEDLCRKLVSDRISS